MTRFKQAFSQLPFWIVFSFLHLLLGILLVAVLLPCSRTAGKAAATDKGTPAASDPVYKRPQAAEMQWLPLTRNH